MDCCVQVYFGGIVRKEDGEFEDMKEELEWFDEPLSFNDLCVRLNAKFGGDFTIKGRFDSGNSPIAEVVVENGYRLEDDHHDDVGGDEEAVPFTSSQLYMDGQLT
jgi:hypothetical protein